MSDTSITPRFFRITLQDPDGIEDSIREAVRERFDAEGLVPRRRAMLEGDEFTALSQHVKAVMPHAETVTVVFDSLGTYAPRVVGADDDVEGVLTALLAMLERGETEEKIEAWARAMRAQRQRDGEAWR